MDTKIFNWIDALMAATGSLEVSIVAVFATAIAIALMAHSAIFIFVRRALSQAGKPGLSHLIMTRVRALTQLAFILASILIVLPAAEFDAVILATMNKVLQIGFIVLGGGVALAAIDATATWAETTHRLDLSKEDENNLPARRLHTQTRILRRIGSILVVLLTLGGILVTFPAVQAYGVSLFASAGVAGIAIGFAARPILANIIAGVQIALTQPIRIDDVVIVEGEWGWIEEFTMTYVVIRIWDQRRLIVPLSYFLEKPFENWTHKDSAIIGVVLWHVDYRAPIGKMRAKLIELAKANPKWNGRVANLQVIESNATTLTVRALVSAKTSPRAWDLRCDVREDMIAWLREDHPEALPRVRAVAADDVDAHTTPGSSAVAIREALAG